MTKTIGIALVMLGIIAFVFWRIGYDRQTTVLDVGGIKATATEHKTFPLAPLIGTIALISGIVVLAVPKKRLD